MRPCLLCLVATCCLGCSDEASVEGPSSEPIEGIGRDAVFVVNGGDATISVVDPSTAALVGAITLSGVEYPHHAYLDAAGERLYVAAPGVDLSGGHAAGGGEHGGHGGGEDMPTATAMVLALDAADGSLLAFRELDAPNHNAIPVPGGGEVWTSASGTPGAVIVLDAETLAESERIAVGDDPAEITFSPDGTLAFVCNTGSGSVSVVDVASKIVLATLPVGMTPVGAWPGSDGNMYVDNEGSRSISVISPATMAVTQTLELDFTPAFAAVAGQELWVTDTEAGSVVAFDLADLQAGPVRTIATGPGAHAIALGADGSTAFVTNQSGDSVSVIDVATGTATTIPVGAAPNGMAVRSGS